MIKGCSKLKLFIAHLLLNILWIIVSILLYHLFWIWKGKTQPRLNAVVFLSVCMITTIACLTFAAEPYHGYLFDFRHIVLIIATLTGGPAAGGIVWLIMSIYRFFLGGDGAVLGFVCSSAVYVFVLFVYPTLRTALFQKKIKLLTAISLIYVLWTPIFLGKTFNPYEYMLYVIVYFICSIVGIYITLYLMEILTVQARLQQELMNVEKFQLIGEMAASISHEIRNPLTSTRGFLQLMQSESCSAQERQLYLETAISGIDQANHVITDYLTFAKPSIEAVQPLRIEGELDNLVSLVMPLANFGNVKIQYDRPNSALYIKGERQKLQQCLLNIAKNCIEAMPSGGVLSIAAKEEENAIAIYIKDTGLGMNEEQLRRLGSPFYSTKEKGTGLGMMVVFSVMKAMGGTIDISSEVKVGTSFCLSFPRVAREKQDEKAQAFVTQKQHRQLPNGELSSS